MRFAFVLGRSALANRGLLGGLNLANQVGNLGCATGKAVGSDNRLHGIGSSMCGDLLSHLFRGITQRDLSDSSASNQFVGVAGRSSTPHFRHRAILAGRWAPCKGHVDASLRLNMAFPPVKRILVTGGAGYIGSHMTLLLAQEGFEVVAMDNLQRGHAQAIGAIQAAMPTAQVTLVQADITDSAVVEAILRTERIDAVIHFAALAYVGESVEIPLDYWRTNLGGTISLLSAMRTIGVHRLVFSSTCSTYGIPDAKLIPISESCPQLPVNPYGNAKLAAERAIADHQRSEVLRGRPFSFAALRYFNVIGSDALARIGEDHFPETHLVPSCLLSALGQRGPLEIHGTDYPTPDGTCVRDYVDVVDLCHAHLATLRALEGNCHLKFNVATGQGHSVREVIQACERVCGVSIETVLGPRRAGDPPTLVADASLIARTLGWKPATVSIDASIANAWQWFRANPRGYR